MTHPQGKIVQLHAIDPNGNVRALECDSNDYLYVAAIAANPLDTHVWGYDGSTWVRVKVTSAGAVEIVYPTLLAELQAKLNTSDLNLDATGDLQVDMKTAPTLSVECPDGDKIFGFQSTLGLEFYDVNLNAGTNEIPSSQCPSNKIWVVTAAEVRVVSSSVTRAVLEATFGGVSCRLIDQSNPVSGQAYIWTGRIFGNSGDYLNMIIYSATGGDDAYANALGYVMEAP